MLDFIFLFLFFTVPVIFISFFSFLIKGRVTVKLTLFRIAEIVTVVLAPISFLWALDVGKVNDCCGDSAIFAPDHRLSIYVLTFLCMAAYLYSTYRKQIATPIVEVVTNCFLLIGLILNIFVAIQISTEVGLFFWLPGNVPIILLLLLVLVKNQKLLLEYLQQQKVEHQGLIQKIALRLLLLPPVFKMPLLILLSVPLTIMIVLLLLLVGQQPNSMIRAFTDTYRHGFSTLDYMCDNVNCGGHYLCSVAAKGHRGIVKPKRLGERNGEVIICNRQLLIANAFEELLEEYAPSLHGFIRKNYNKVGNLIHRYYYVFNKPLVSDVIYILMKPLEWIFLLVLYTLDKNPENRIAVQYLRKVDRSWLKQHNTKN